MFLRDLPQSERNRLCACLDANNNWRDLGKKLGFDDLTMNKIQRLVSSSMKSPTDYLLGEWESWGDDKISTLFVCMSIICTNNFQAVEILKPFVDEKFHHLITEEGCFSSKNQYSPLSPYNSSKLATTLYPIGLAAASQPQEQMSEPITSKTTAKLDPSLTQSSRVCSFHIPYEELQQGTNNWNERLVLGKGSFGKVFKGSWKNTEVAIKRLEPKIQVRPNNLRTHKNSLYQSLTSLKKELKYLTKYRHDNILPLYGYSTDGEKHCLVYQFMSNGSLNDRLQRRQNTPALSWWKRVTIARGSARGLQFLHSVDDVLIHGDIKSANILLDLNFVPKIGDFGLGREGPIKDYTYIDLTTVQGTLFYLPPEVLRGKKLSVKADTYAFGVVLCELATGLKAGGYGPSKRVYLLRDTCHNAVALNCLSCYKDHHAENRDDGFYSDLVKLGIKCTSEIAKERPLMADVLDELEIMVKSRER